MHAKVIIVGFGPSGIACAIQLKRMGMDPVIIEKGNPGGMLVNANLIENYPGFPNGIPGDRLAAIFEKQASGFNLNLVKDTVVNINYKGNTFHLDGSSRKYTCNTLVMATGTLPRLPEIFPDDLVSMGLIHTDISAIRKIGKKTFGIIGAGDAAFDYALTLAGNQENLVYIFNRSEEIKALKILQERVNRHPGIKYLPNQQLLDINLLPHKCLKLRFTENSKPGEFILDYLIFATGRIAAQDMISVEMNRIQGRLVNEHKLYLIGDVINGNFRQLSVAVGDGVKAAMEICQHGSNQ